jgi:hypothetical protein
MGLSFDKLRMKWPWTKRKKVEGAPRRDSLRRVPQAIGQPSGHGTPAVPGLMLVRARLDAAQTTLDPGAPGQALVQRRPSLGRRRG